jgi:hypothetical protein
VSEIDRHKFEREYRDWIVSMAKEIARQMACMSETQINQAMEGYERFRDPSAVFNDLADIQRIKHLASDQASNYIFAETGGVTFFPSIHSTLPGVLDFAVAMTRRFFYQDLWFPIIALNSEYIKRSSDKVLGFTLEHEFEMSRIYQQISANLRVLSEDDKRDIANSAQEISAKRKQITQDELIEDEKLMVWLSKSLPLIPKPYAEIALLTFLEDNFSNFRSLGIPSESDDELSFGLELYREFKDWADFSKNTYALFVREIAACLNESNLGYA